MSFRNISAWAIRNPLFPIILFVALTLLGVASFLRLGVNNDPDIEFPVVFVVILQPSAAPAELETQVTQRVEAAARSVQGVEEIASETTDGMSRTRIQLALGTPIDRAVNDVRDRVAQIRGELPEGILEPQILRAATTSRDLASYSAVADDMTIEQLSWYIDHDVARELFVIPGLAVMNRSGGVSREILVKLDLPRLQALGLTASEINRQLQLVNLDSAGGRVEILGSEHSVRVLGGAADAVKLAQTRIAIGAGRTVRLGDVGRVADLYAERRSHAAVDGRETVSFDIQRGMGASDVAVFHAVERKLAQLEARNPRVRFVLNQNSASYTEKQYDSAMRAMAEGAALAVLVVFLFLRDWRATLIAAITIPLSAVPSFWFMEMLGFTLNQMTLMALSLVAGVLVDDAIVEIENVIRHMRTGKTAFQASIDAADEIGLAVIATTMAIVAVFLPVGLMPGISGQFFKNFGLTVVASVLMSLAVARLVTPMIAAYFLKSAGHAPHGEGRSMLAYLALLRWSLDDGAAARARQRGGIARRFARLRDHRLWVLAIWVLAVVCTVLLFVNSPQTFQPPRDLDSSAATIQMVPGTTLTQTEAAVRRVAELLRRRPEVASVYSRSNVGNGVVIASLRPDRRITSTEFERALATDLAAVPDARVSFRPQFGWGSSNRELTIVLAGDDPALLDRTARKIVAEMAALPMLRAPRTASDLNQPQIAIRPRSALAADLGVTTAALSNAIRVATIGEIDQNGARFTLGGREVPIRVALDPAWRASLATIRDLPVPTASGGSVPLRLVADVRFDAAPARIQRLNQQRQVTLGADLAPGAVSGEARRQVDVLPTMRNLPPGVTQVVVGEAKWAAEALSNFKSATIAALLLVFAVLVLLYRRFLPPFVNLASLLPAPLGGLLALSIAGKPISMVVYIGILMLLGIVAKNSILLIDFALEEMGKGVQPKAAIVDAGHKRAQPIVMTTVAMVAGMVPTALSLAGDGSFNAPMGITVIGGLLVSTLLTLLTTPAIFSLTIGLEHRLRRIGRGRVSG